MATLAELLAGKTAGQEPPVPKFPAPAETGDHPLGPNPPPAPQPNVLLPPPAGYLGRQDASEPLPRNWPPDVADFCTGNDLIVIQNPHLESFLAIRRPHGQPPLYLLGPFPTLNIPF